MVFPAELLEDSGVTASALCELHVPTFHSVELHMLPNRSEPETSLTESTLPSPKEPAASEQAEKQVSLPWKRSGFICCLTLSQRLGSVPR